MGSVLGGPPRRTPARAWASGGARLEGAEGYPLRRAILSDPLYVIIHGEWRPMAAARHAAIIAAMPEKLDPALVAMLQGGPRQR
jgi:hypothetical protein